MDPSNQQPSMSLPTPEPTEQSMPQPAPAPVQPPTDKQSTPQQAAATVAKVAPDSAADSDKLELQWINKVKQIVRDTRDDPYEQNRQLAALKADYMQKRYGKVVKLSE